MENIWSIGIAISLWFFLAANETENSYELDPGFMYYFLGAAADVAANPKINASAIYFQPNMAYSSSFQTFYNKTMPLFAPRAFRWAGNFMRFSLSPAQYGLWLVLLNVLQKNHAPVCPLGIEVSRQVNVIPSNLSRLRVSGNFRYLLPAQYGLLLVFLNLLQRNHAS